MEEVSSKSNSCLDWDYLLPKLVLLANNIHLRV